MKMMKGSTKPMNQVEIAWLAGIIEGEGCFDRSKKVVSIKVKMTDEDTIYKCQEFSGMGNVSGPFIEEEGHKPFWIWRVSKRRDVFRLFLAIAPLLSGRRKAKILELTHVVFGE